MAQPCSRMLKICPAAYTKVSDRFSGWHYEDDEWTGIWSASPGYADQEDMQFSDVDLILEIKSINGQIDGVIATKKMCEALPWDFILIGGCISGNKADILAWDIVGGEKTNFAKLTLERSGAIMTVSPTEGRVEWFPQKVRVSLHPQSDQAENNKIFSDFCGRRKEALSSQRHSERKRY